MATHPDRPPDISSDEIMDAVRAVIGEQLHAMADAWTEDLTTDVVHVVLCGAADAASSQAAR